MIMINVLSNNVTKNFDVLDAFIVFVLIDYLNSLIFVLFEIIFILYFLICV